MYLYLIRHGVASSSGESMAFLPADLESEKDEDLQRPLTDEGRRKARRAIRGMAALFPAPDVIFASGALRSIQTADLAASVWKCSDVRSEPALNPGAGPDAYLERLNRLRQEDGTLKDERVAFVTHEPDLGLFLGHLLAGNIVLSEGGEGLTRSVRESHATPIPLKKAAIAVVGFVDGHGELQGFLNPGLLRRVAKM